LKEKEDEENEAGKKKKEEDAALEDKLKAAKIKLDARRLAEKEAEEIKLDGR